MADIGSLQNISNLEIYANKMWKEKIQIYTKAFNKSSIDLEKGCHGMISIFDKTRFGNISIWCVDDVLCKMIFATRKALFVGGVLLHWLMN